MASDAAREWYIVRVDAQPGVEVPGGSFVTVESGPHGGMAQALHALEHPKPRAHVLPDIVWLPEDAPVWTVNQPVAPKPRLIVMAETVQQAREAKGGRGLVAGPARQRLHASSRGREANTAEVSMGHQHRQQHAPQSQQQPLEPPAKRPLAGLSAAGPSQLEQQQQQQAEEEPSGSLALTLLVTPPPGQAGAVCPGSEGDIPAMREPAEGQELPQQAQQAIAPRELFPAGGRSAADRVSPQPRQQQQNQPFGEGLAQRMPLPQAAAAAAVCSEPLPPSAPGGAAAAALGAAGGAMASQDKAGPRLWDLPLDLSRQPELPEQQRRRGWQQQPRASPAPDSTAPPPSSGALASLSQPPTPVRTVLSRREGQPTGAAACPSALNAELSPSHSQVRVVAPAPLLEARPGQAGASSAAAAAVDGPQAGFPACGPAAGDS